WGGGGGGGVFGASGGGKSSLIKVLACLKRANAGEVYWQGLRVDNLSEGKLRPWRHLVQVVFQEPGSSFNPRHTVGFALREALHRPKTRLGKDAVCERERLAQLFSLVGLPFSEEMLARRIFEFSGGQRQRLSLVRALAAEPKVLLLDEPVASLDVPVRRRFLDSLAELVPSTGLAVLLVTHDLNILDGLARRVVVLLSGRVVEEGPWAEVKRSPLHPYTRALLDATEDVLRWQRFFLPAPSGCPFRLACPWASAACLAEPHPQACRGRRVACFHPLIGNISREKLVQTQREGG
ncbi:MAG: ATP-binding cassette domain-containing protein, partial [Thermoanaerobaculum sp.]